MTATETPTKIDTLIARQQTTVAALQDAQQRLRALSSAQVLAELDGEAEKLATLQTEAAAVEREIATHTRDTERLDGAIAELRRRESAENRARALAALKAQHDAVHKTGKRMGELAAKIIDAVEVLGPLLAEYATLSAERATHARNVILPAKFRDGAYRDRYAGAAHRREGVFAGILAAAVWRSGLGRVGLDMGEWMRLAPIDRHAWYAQSDLQSAMRQAIEAGDQRLEVGMESGLQAAAAEAERV